MTTKIITRTATALVAAWALGISPGRADGLAGVYTDPQYQTRLPFGWHSHWVQPWRATLETVPAGQFVQALGIGENLGNSENPDLIAQMLAKYGIKNARVEIGWSSLRYSDDTQIENPARLQTRLRALQRWNLRPLILLNGNQGAPCPLRFFNRTVTTNAAVGVREVTLDDVSGLVIGKSGLCDLTGYWAAEALVTAVDGNTVTLSKPLPRAIAANTSVRMAKLKYRPFSPPGSADYNETIAGWKRYVETIATFVTDTLGTGASVDKGFDLEIWNELSFGSNFLSINKYYDPDPYSYPENSVWNNVVCATAEVADAQPAKYSGVLLCDGFANTIPWPASSTEPPRVRSLSHHPYKGRSNYPASDQGPNRINALLQQEPNGWVPTYSINFPEYYGTAIQTETVLRDASPITTGVYGTNHGRNARVVDGQVIPCPLWITEIGTAPNEDGVTDPAAALALKAKTTARYFCFYVHKGVERLYLYAAKGGDTWLGIVQDNFLNYTKTNTVYPADDAAFVSPALRVTGRIVAKMKQGLDPNLSGTRSLQVLGVSDTHNHYQFAGDGTDAHPNLYNRELLALLPFQVNARRFVIPYYVMTRDVKRSFVPESYTVELAGLNGIKAAITAYDPLSDTAVPVTINGRTGNRVVVTLVATDYPRLLLVQEGSAKPGDGFTDPF